VPAFGEGEQVGEADPAVPSRLVVGDLAVFEELDQGRAADAEEVGGLLGGQPLGARDERDDLALANGLHHLDHDPVDLLGQRHS
jgi:hypothetical protein